MDAEQFAQLIQQFMQQYSEHIKEYAKYWTGWFPYIGIPLLFFIFATGIFLILIWYRLRAMNRTQKLLGAVSMFDKLHQPEGLEANRNLYEQFCNNKFQLDIENISEDQWKDIATTVRSFEEIGAFVHENIIDERFAVTLLTDVCVRLWIVLEGYIRRERNRRHYPLLYAKLEYLAVLCIRYLLSTPSKEIAIYQPSNPDVSNTYDADYLTKKLHELEADMKKLGLRT